MEIKKELDINALLNDANAVAPSEATTESISSAQRDVRPMLRRIPVTLTLEVGAAEISLHDLISIEHGTVVELDRLVGEPLAIKVNGIQIGRAEVVVAGENYGLKVVELEDLGLDTLI